MFHKSVHIYTGLYLMKDKHYDKRHSCERSKGFDFGHFYNSAFQAYMIQICMWTLKTYRQFVLF